MAEPQSSIFISHAHEDRRIVEALEKALIAVLSSRVSINHSSKHGEIQGGKSWLNWIRDQVRHCDLAIILITPTSQYRPWVLWEAGSVEGAARLKFSEQTDPDARVVPISLLGDGATPETFTEKQVVDGLNAKSLAGHFMQVADIFSSALSESERRTADRSAHEIAGEAVERFQLALQELPAVLNQSLIRDWYDRLDRLMERNEYVEAANFVRWARLTFRGTQKGRIDFGLHRRFGDIYRATKNWSLAKEEYDYALTYSPRDIVLLRYQARVCLELPNLAEANKYLQRILLCDPEAIESSEEIAALAARYYREHGDYVQAVETLRRYKGHSLYVANNIAMYRTKIAELLAQAEGDFARLLDVLKTTSVRDKWVMAMEINALIGLRKMDEARAVLGELGAMQGSDQPTADQIKSMSKDWEYLAKLATPGRKFDWQSALEPGAGGGLDAADPNKKS